LTIPCIIRPQAAFKALQETPLKAFQITVGPEELKVGLALLKKKRFFSFF
jgi:hypothetical protein